MARYTTVTPPPFWSLVEAHGGGLLAHARGLVGDADAEDVVHEALLRALRGYGRLRHAEHLRAWLYRITTTTAYDHHRARRREILTDDPPDDGHADPGDDGAFEALIAPLPDAAQAALRLRFVDDLDYDRIAKALGCSSVAARQRVSVAIRTLRKELA